MNGKARATRWREKQVAGGGKPIGVTLTAPAALALESLQSTFRWSQREAISLALEFAAHHQELLAKAPEASPQAESPLEHGPDSRIADLEARLSQLEALLAGVQQAKEQVTPEEEARRNKEALIGFTARQMMEHGERMSRVQLYAAAKQQGVPVPGSQHEYNVFISYHMDVIRDMMRTLKERTH
ncbi:hypothetical protein NNJEOMEG_00312 [Fundidesulfovibrio magnetotacticus]|uniref:Uncharacterized protein n=1 Tax=Fundidesulfovibrio magnetotacticus TaxID=2730080 RepID=A0A6V8LSA1_9BACT|nr:hypothetical protein [Fundidesulfovibrio magnetotacticus]GFK92487.1 hypothetical protein NNJEOMEG_00312 [Fundidesulfovibrio magnetotacticus]